MEYEEIQGWDAFATKYKPIKNRFRNYDSEQFETFGEEWEFVKSQDPRYVWTWIQGDMSDLIVNGIGFVNRFCYYICEEPWEEGKEYLVLLSVEEECSCYSDEDSVMETRGGDFGDPDCNECNGYGLVTKYVGD